MVVLTMAVPSTVNLRTTHGNGPSLELGNGLYNLGHVARLPFMGNPLWITACSQSGWMRLSNLTGRLKNILEKCLVRCPVRCLANTAVKWKFLGSTIVREKLLLVNITEIFTTMHPAGAPQSRLVIMMRTTTRCHHHLHQYLRSKRPRSTK
jgi:hypothetical protein